MYEKKHEALASVKTYRQRLLNNGLITCFVLLVSLGIGVLGYHFICGFAWIDALLNASMILSGMGPVDSINNDAGKIFSSVYAIFSGVVFISSVGFLLTPAIHRFFHYFFHFQDK
jgi:hypothetical protein